MSIKPNLSLGRGLGAILGQNNTNLVVANVVTEVEIDKILPNQDQPRQFFDPQSINDLAQSIKMYGIIQPITVRKHSNDEYQIISGERRWQAAKSIALLKVPVYIRDIGDDEIIQVALIENIQREDLNPIEIAMAYSRLVDEYNMTHQEISDQVGKDRATVTNYLRLLRLSTEIQIGLRAKRVSMGHARALLSLDSVDLQLKFYNICIEKALSVRALESMIAQFIGRKNKKSEPSNSYDKKTIKSYTNHIANKLYSTVKISATPNGAGEIKIKFKNPDDLERIFTFLTK